MRRGYDRGYDDRRGHGGYGGQGGNHGGYGRPRKNDFGNNKGNSIPQEKNESHLPATKIYKILIPKTDRLVNFEELVEDSLAQAFEQSIGNVYS